MKKVVCFGMAGLFTFITVTSHGAADAPLRYEFKKLLDSRGLALALVKGRSITIHSFGGDVIEVPFKSQFLISRIDATGTKIVGWGYPGSEPSKFPSLLVCDIHGQVIKQINGIINVSGLALAQDGKKIAVVGTNLVTGFKGLQILSAEASSFPSNLPVESRSLLGDDLSWSADNQELVYNKSHEIRVFNINTRLTRIIANGTRPSWSPNGVWIAFVSNRSRLVLYEVSTGQSFLTPSDRKSESTALWAPDSGWFAVAENQGGRKTSRGCYGNVQLVVYRMRDLAHFDVMDPCSLKPNLFGWISNWQTWANK